MNVEETKHIPLMVPQFDKEMAEAALYALRNEHFVLGEEVFRFEEEFADYVGVHHAVSTSSGTNALQIALLSLGVGGGSEVITSAFSFVASANSVYHAGGVPRFADINRGSFNVDVDRMRKMITKNTRVLLPVHLYGYPCDMGKIVDLAEECDLKVVEDACQAHGAIFHGRKVGSIGNVGCFSFYSSKNMTVCGDGGMVVTNDEDIAKLAAKLRDCGRKTRYEHDVIGYTSRLNTVNASIGRIQLRRLDQWNKRRAEHASLYDDLLESIDQIRTPPKGNVAVTPVYHLYVVEAQRRDELREWLQNKGVQCGVHYPLPIPLQPIYRSLCGFTPGEFPVSEAVSKVCLSLPIFPQLKREDIIYVCDKIRDFYESI
jgi:perosamine synthetase